MYVSLLPRVKYLFNSSLLSRLRMHATFFNSWRAVNLKKALNYSQFDLSPPRIAGELYRLRRICVNERKCARLPGHPVRAAAAQLDRYKSVYTACRGENTVCTLVPYGRLGEFGDPVALSPPFHPFGKWQIRERQTISLPYGEPEGAHVRINPLSFRGSVPRRGPLTSDNTAPIKESNPHLRYYTCTRIIQGQIWALPNAVEFTRAIFILGPRDSLIWSTWCMSIQSLIYDNGAIMAISRARKCDCNFWVVDTACT